MPALENPQIRLKAASIQLCERESDSIHAQSAFRGKVMIKDFSNVTSLSHVLESKYR